MRTLRTYPILKRCFLIAVVLFAPALSLSEQPPTRIRAEKSLKQVKQLLAKQQFAEADKAMRSFRRRFATSPFVEKHIKQCAELEYRINSALADPEIRRVLAIRKTVKGRIHRIPPGDVKTLIRTLNNVKPGDGIALATGRYKIEKPLTARPGPLTIWARAGHWPVIRRYGKGPVVKLPAGAAWRLDGLVLIGRGPRLIQANRLSKITNCSIRGTRGSTGVTLAGQLADCIFMDLKTGIRQASTVDNCFFLNVTNPIDPEMEDFTGSLRGNLFHRAKTVYPRGRPLRCGYNVYSHTSPQNGKREPGAARFNATFVDESKGDFRPMPKSRLARFRGFAGTGAGPRWPQQRWFMLRSNFPLDVQNVRCLQEDRKIAEDLFLDAGRLAKSAPRDRRRRKRLADELACLAFWFRMDPSKKSGFPANHENLQKWMLTYLKFNRSSILKSWYNLVNLSESDESAPPRPIPGSPSKLFR